MENPKFTPVAPPQTELQLVKEKLIEVEGRYDRIRELLKDCPQEITVNGETTHYTTVDLVENLRNAADHTGALYAAALEELAEAKRILRELVAAGVLTDGFMTNAVGQSLLNQAAAAKRFLEAHP